MLEYRPLLYRAADALDPSGGVRELADSLYADLYGVRERDGRRSSLLDYFHGRSSLATWLRAVLAQRYVDRIRARRRLEPLPDDGGEVLESAAFTARSNPDVHAPREHVVRLRRALTASIARLSPRDRLRLGCYYQEELTLAETGRALGEHEATASRQLARTRRAIRDDVERRLRTDGLNEDQIRACFEAVTADSGPLDLREMLAAADRKESPQKRS